MKRLYFLIWLTVAVFLITGGIRAQEPAPLGPIIEKWSGSPTTPIMPVDFDGDGQEDFSMLAIDDLATPSSPDAALFGTPVEGRIWAVIEWQESRWEIVWFDPEAPQAWIEWLREQIRPREAVEEVGV